MTGDDARARVVSELVSFPDWRYYEDEYLSFRYPEDSLIELEVTKYKETHSDFLQGSDDSKIL